MNRLKFESLPSDLAKTSAYARFDIFETKQFLNLQNSHYGLTVQSSHHDDKQNINEI